MFLIDFLCRILDKCLMIKTLRNDFSPLHFIHFSYLFSFFFRFFLWITVLYLIENTQRLRQQEKRKLRNFCFQHYVVLINIFISIQRRADLHIQQIKSKQNFQNPTQQNTKLKKATTNDYSALQSYNSEQ